jgi:DUF971 family protein
MGDLKPGPVKPVRLKKEGEGLAIDWSDGLQSHISWQRLRDNCPCANCREERAKPADPFRILTVKDLERPAQVAPLAMSPVGHYAYKIQWNDGHDTGIYTIENLRELSESNNS